MGPAARTAWSPCRRGRRSRASRGRRYDLVEPGQRAVVAAGGVGGHGNKRFASSTRQAPRFAERGLKGESGWIELRLKLLADAGLVGQPNAGKSSLLGRLTRAAPKVAAYPFTTVEPVLGTIDSGDRQLVLADIPGLIEGAAGGAGLGHEFLAHVERCRMLIHLVDIGGRGPAGRLRGGAGGAGRLPARARAPARAGGAVEARPGPRRRRGRRGRGVGDALARRRVGRLRRLVGDREPGWRSYDGRSSTAVPADAEDPRRRPAAEPEFEAEHIVYRPAGEEGFDVGTCGEGVFGVAGRGIELLFARHDLRTRRRSATWSSACARSA